MRKYATSEAAVAAGIALAFCAVFAFLVTSFARVSSATFDEVTHLPAGYSYLRLGDYRLNPEHPPLIKKLAALPLLFRPLEMPHVDAERPEDLLPGDAMITTGLRMKRVWALGLVDHESAVVFGHAFLYGVRDEVAKQFADSLPRFDSMMIPPTAKLNKGDFINDADDLLFWGRMPVLLLGMLLAVFVFLWARELFGLAGGVLAIALFCFEPNFIAHSGLVTTDVGVTFFMFGAIYFLWRTCRRIEIASVFLMSLFVGLALASKFTAVLLAPMFVLLALGRIFSREEWPISLQREFKLVTRPSKALAVIALFIAVAIFSYGLLWATYGFRFSPVKNSDQVSRNEAVVLSDLPKEFTEPFLTHLPGHFPVEELIRRGAAKTLLLQEGHNDPSEAMVAQTINRAQPGLIGNILLFVYHHQLVPEAYLYGLVEAEAGLLRCDSFLRGEYSTTGFGGTYFLWTFLLKTPLVTIAAIAGALIWVALHRRAAPPWVAFVLVPVVVYWGVALASNISIGHRHLLPIYPFLFVMCGGLAMPWAKLRPGIKPWIGVAALAAIVMSSFMVFIPQRPYIAAVYPHYLAYFNELAGGPPNGYRSLVDSNLDWGQDLKKLKAWLDNKRLEEGTPFYLCYFGMADPRYHRIAHINVPGGYSLEPETPLSGIKTPCYFAISATNLQGVYTKPPFREYYSRLLKDATLVDRVGYSIFIYYFPPPAS